MACAARARSGDRALRGLLLLCLWLPNGRASGPPLSELHAQLSGVQQLLEDFRRQLQREPPAEELELELRAGGGPREGCPGAGGDGYRALPDAIIRTKDSLAAGASFLRAPAAVWDWRQCVAACCAEPRCSVAVVELPPRPAPPAAALGCFLFNCTARGRSVCKFAPHRGYRSYRLRRTPDAEQGGLGPGALVRATSGASPELDQDAPPLSKAGQDVVLHLPTDEVILDGRESSDDHAIVQYEWTLLQGDPSVNMKVQNGLTSEVAGSRGRGFSASHSKALKVPHPGTLKLSHLQEGMYTLQLTVTDTVGQRSSDNVSVTVHPRTSSPPGGCLNICLRYHFFCDDGCCIDITLTCDGVRQCPDGSDEDFCQNLGLDRKLVTHTAVNPALPGTTGLIANAGEDSQLEKSQKPTPPNLPATLSSTEKNHSALGEPESQISPVMPDTSSLGKNRNEENFIFESKSHRRRGEHPAPEAGWKVEMVRVNYLEIIDEEKSRATRDEP
ncbi:low-density lipoprotein receptor-related protein 11 isoform X2 [Heterocephalus glaber]|uniref:Low-density lipoprotein receptor-related protein 11 isoform X2 n=1 Tax=Heterocephalus glaber TaxID=10181 RepID=A0AAX6R8L7_HETGA|nr:low-density lipoprotein receptor-related protein 11 isoform X2 [Heterocephalus glaber]